AAEHVRFLFRELLDETVYYWAKTAPDANKPPDGVICGFYPVNPSLLNDLKAAAEGMPPHPPTREELLVDVEAEIERLLQADSRGRGYPLPTTSEEAVAFYRAREG